MEWMREGCAVRVETHAWAETENITLIGIVRDVAGPGIELEQTRMVYDELQNENLREIRRVFVPWGSVVYVSEANWHKPGAIDVLRTLSTT